MEKEKKVLEVCTDSIESAIAAKKGGADRIELCSNLIIGGTTPDTKMYRIIQNEAGIPARILIRPRFGDFCYSKYEKELILEQIQAFREEGAQGVVVVDYRGLTVEQDTQLRKQLREAGVVYKVYKNTLVKRAIAGTEFEPMAEVLEGPNAIAICKEDATAPARVLANFAKTADALELKCGVVEGTYYDATGIAAIANIPSRDELLAKFLGSIQSPITNFARVIKQIAEKNEEVA